MNIIDVVVLLFLLMGIVIGFKRGAIQSICVLVGTIAVVVISFILKNPLAAFMYNHLPFFEFKNSFLNTPIINILIYRGIAFIILLIIFSSILSVILKVTGIISKIVDYSIVLTLPSKLIGMFLGFIESYIFIFIFLFIFSQFSFSQEVLSDSKLTDIILSKTPFTINIRNSYKAFNEINDIDKNTTNANKKSIDIVKKYNLITDEDLKKLIEKGKIEYRENEV